MRYARSARRSLKIFKHTLSFIDHIYISFFNSIKSYDCYSQMCEVTDCKFHVTEIYRIPVLRIKETEILIKMWLLRMKVCLQCPCLIVCEDFQQRSV